MKDEWTIVRSCSWLHEAEFVKSLLESEGVEARIPDEYAVGVNPGYTNMLGGVRVLVRADQLARANEILESAAPPSAAAG
jgi:hypothetical protein